ncbi:MAG: hypothetical protein AAF740_11910, partial [Bacteroidota bacterium]
MLKYELQSILSGTRQVSQGALIQTITRHLGRSAPTSPMAQDEQQNKHQEKEKLIAYATKHNLWVSSIDFEGFISAGAEQRVFIKGDRYVYKLNDAIYYASWIDYFDSLLLNNFFFPDTAYNLLGFHLEEDILFAVVMQPYVKADTPTEISEVKKFMKNNGFENTRN